MIPGPQQDCGDEHDLDENDREGEDERSVGVAEAVGELLGLVDDTEGTDEDDADDDDERGDEQGGRYRWFEQRPGEGEGDERAPAQREADDGGGGDDIANGGSRDGRILTLRPSSS